MKAKSIKTWNEEERPREKLMQQGAAALSNTELLAILIGSGTRTQTAVDLAREIVAACGGSLASLSQQGYARLMQVDGVGPAKAASVLATFELARRLAAEIPEDEFTIRNSETAARMMSPLLRDLPHEECWVLYLNRAGRYIGKEKVSVGGLGSTIIDIKIIVKPDPGPQPPFRQSPSRRAGPRPDRRPPQGRRRLRHHPGGPHHHRQEKIFQFFGRELLTLGCKKA